MGVGFRVDHGVRFVYLTTLLAGAGYTTAWKWCGIGCLRAIAFPANMDVTTGHGDRIKAMQKKLELSIEHLKRNFIFGPRFFGEGKRYN